MESFHEPGCEDGAGNHTFEPIERLIYFDHTGSLDIADGVRDAKWFVASQVTDGKTDNGSRAITARRDEETVLCQLARCIFGNPFRPVTADPSWLNSTVVALARGIYDERAFDRMPILADALQDAGCDNEDVLNHCRDPHGVHARGCWVVDLVLGKS